MNNEKEYVHIIEQEESMSDFYLEILVDILRVDKS